MSKTLLIASVIAVAGTAASAQILYNNGPLGTGPLSQGGPAGPQAAPAGFQWSEVANDGIANANTSAGFSGHVSGTSGTFRIADDFVVPAGSSWDVTGFCTYGYQTGSAATASPISGGSFNVWNGRPADVGSAIIGTATFDVMTNTNMLRTFNTLLPAPATAGTTRLIRQVDWNVVGSPLTLGPGSYWIDFQYTTTPAAGTVFVPGVTIPGTRTLPGWNGRQFTGAVGTGWVDAIDTGNPATAADVNVDFPFIVKGIPAPGSLALLGIGGLVAARRRRI